MLTLKVASHGPKGNLCELDKLRSNSSTSCNQGRGGRFSQYGHFYFFRKKTTSRSCNKSARVRGQDRKIPTAAGTNQSAWLTEFHPLAHWEKKWNCRWTIHVKLEKNIKGLKRSKLLNHLNGATDFTSKLLGSAPLYQTQCWKQWVSRLKEPFFCIKILSFLNAIANQTPSFI